MNPSTHASLLMDLVILLPTIFVGFLLPWLNNNRRGILFGVTIPLDFAASPLARASVRRYRQRVTLIATFITVGLTLLLWLTPESPLTLIAVVGAVPIELVAAFLLWRHESTLIKPHAAIIPLERHADLAPTPSTAAPLAAIALSVLPLAAAALWLRRDWSHIPSRWPNHWDIHGLDNGWAVRTVSGVFSPIFFGTLLTLVFFAVALFISKASGPQVSQRRRGLLPLACFAWLVTGLLSLVATIPLTHLSSSDFIVITLVYLVITFSIAFWLLFRSGLTPKARTSEPYDSTPDASWHGGIIYYNPSDASIIVPKRFGLGWTLNFARPASWIYLSGILLVIAVMSLLLK